MAQQVQFIQLSQDEYDNLATKNSGSLYFTTDTHRIYKGEDLYASTTFDDLKFDELEATSIQVNGKDVSVEGHTHTTDDIEDFPTNVSSFTNDVGYLKSSELDLSGYMPITGATLINDFSLISPNGNVFKWDNEFGWFDFSGENNGVVFNDGTNAWFESGSYSHYTQGSWIEFETWDDLKLTSSQTIEQFIKLLITSTSHTHTKSDITDFQHTHYKNEILDFDHIHTKEDVVDFEHTHEINEVNGLIEALDELRFNETEIFITEED